MKTPSRFLALFTCLIGLLVPAVLTGCSADPTAAATGQGAQAERPLSPGRIGVEDFAALIATPGVQVIDVRTPEEFAGGHLPGAVNIPIQGSDFGQRIARLDPTAAYAVYCRSGNRSRPAVAAMKDAGITEIYELASGTNGWTAGGQSLVS